MHSNLFQVDSFADRPFTGNPAAVFLPASCSSVEMTSWDEQTQKGLTADWMQRLAAEMNLSETAFPIPIGTSRCGNMQFGLRWFTPAAEVDLCGHATLAAAHVLWEQELCGLSEPIVFMTRSGQLTCRNTEAGICMDFPTQAGTMAELDPAVSAALGPDITPLYVSRNQADWLVRLDSEHRVRSAQIDFSALARSQARGLIITAKSETPEFDFISRFFAPAFGVDEDPVTGSAHCFLAPYWAEQLSKNELIGFQASARGGVVRMQMDGARVSLTGKANTIFSARLNEQVMA